MTGSAPGRPLAALLDATRDLLTRSVVLPGETDVTLLSLWVAHTHVFRKFRFTPRLIITAADRACGKSRLLDVLEGLCHSPERGDDFTAASLSRLAPSGHTLIWDEADVRGTRGTSDPAFVALYNGGFCVTGGRALCELDKKGVYKVRRLPTFAPLAICGIGLSLPGASESRSFRVEMRRRGASEQISKPSAEELKALQAELAAWGGAFERGESAPLPELEDRTRDALEPLAGIAGRAGGVWPKRLWYATEELAGIVEADADLCPSHPLAVLEHLLELWPAAGPKVARTEWAAALIESGDAWASGFEGVPPRCTSKRLANLLRSAGLRPRRLYGEDKRQFRGYVREELQRAFDAHKR